MMAPRIQNGGNTAKSVSDVWGHRRETKKIRTESKFEEIHCERDRLDVGIRRVSRRVSVCVGWWWNIVAVERWV